MLLNSMSPREWMLFHLITNPIVYHVHLQFLCVLHFSPQNFLTFFPLPLFPHTFKSPDLSELSISIHWVNDSMDLKSRHLYPALVPLLPLWGENLLCPVLHTFLFLLFWFFLFSTFTLMHVFHILSKPKKWEELLLMKCLPNYYSIILLPLQSNFMNYLSILTSFFPSHLLFPIHYHLASVPVNPMGHFPILIELVSPVAFTTVSHLLFLTLYIGFMTQRFSTCFFSCFLWKLCSFAYIHVLKYWCPQVFMSLRTQFILCPGSFSYSPGFCDLALRELPRPTWRTKESSVYYFYPEALKHFALKMLKAYVISSRICFLFLVSQCQWMTLSSFQLSHLNQKHELSIPSITSPLSSPLYWITKSFHLNSENISSFRPHWLCLEQDTIPHHLCYKDFLSSVLSRLHSYSRQPSVCFQTQTNWSSVMQISSHLSVLEVLGFPFH